MPKSKRAKVVTLSKTQSKGRARKVTLLDEVRSCCDTYQSAFVINAQNMRNTALKEVRARLTGSRLFFGRTKLLASALGRTVSEEYKDCLHQVAMALSGQGEAGLLFTNEPVKRVRAVLEETQADEFARAGCKATHDVELAEGPLLQFPHNMEAYLRTKLGLPTRLVNGVVTLLAAHTVCKEGQELDSEQAKLLQLLNIKMARFQLTLRCRWTDGDFESYEM
jgi:mRNA turnover protein 4